MMIPNIIMLNLWRSQFCSLNDRNTPSQCILCFGNHPENYKWCNIYQATLVRKKRVNTTHGQSQKRFEYSKRFSWLDQKTEWQQPRDTQHRIHRRMGNYVLALTASIIKQSPNSLFKELLVKQSTHLEVLVK